RRADEQKLADLGVARRSAAERQPYSFDDTLIDRRCRGRVDRVPAGRKRARRFRRVVAPQSRALYRELYLPVERRGEIERDRVLERGREHGKRYRVRAFLEPRWVDALDLRAPGIRRQQQRAAEIRRNGVDLPPRRYPMRLPIKLVGEIGAHEVRRIAIEREAK